MKNNFRKFGPIVAVIAIMIGFFFISSWNFHDWLYFKADQARDAALVQDALEDGAENLPLLGPKAGGTYLRLGPLFYYFQYGVVSLTQSASPEMMAYPSLLFCLLAIPLFYYFLRKGFSVAVSLGVLLVFSFSFIFVQYARFAWNPNLLFFWGLLFMVGVYQAATSESKKNAGTWLVIAALGYSVSSQLHFVALLGYPLVAFLFWALYRPKKINWKYWAAAALVVLVTYIPVIISDIETRGNNYQHFIYALSHKESDSHTLAETLGRLSQNFSRHYVSILTSFEFRDSSSKESRLGIIASAIFLVLSFFLAVYRWKKNDAPQIRPFLYFLAVWFFVFLLIYAKLAYSLSEVRFFFPSFFLPFIFLGFILDAVSRRIGKPAYLLILFFVVLNLYGIGRWYYSLMEPNQRGEVLTNLNLKQGDRITLGQIERASEYMIESAGKQKKGVCFRADFDYEASFEYILTRNHPKGLAKRIQAKNSEEGFCQYFLVAPYYAPKEKLDKKILANFTAGEGHEFGALKIWDLTPRNFPASRAVSEKEVTDYFQTAKIKEEEPETETLDPEQSDEPVRKKRVFWTDVFQ